MVEFDEDIPSEQAGCLASDNSDSKQIFYCKHFAKNERYMENISGKKLVDSEFLNRKNYGNITSEFTFQNFISISFLCNYLFIKMTLKEKHSKGNE